MTYRTAYPAFDTETERSTPRLVSKWIAGSLFTIAFLGLLVALQAMQVTSEGAAKRTLERTVAAATEIDVLVERHHDELVARAEAVDANDSLEMEAFPIGVSLTRDEVLGSSPEELREILLERSANVLYEDGADAWLSDQSTGGDDGTFSVAGIVERGIGMLREGVHLFAGFAVIALSVVCIVLAAVVASVSRGFGRLTSVATGVLVASVLFVAGTGLVLLMLETASGDEYIESELIAIGEELAWVPLRNGLAFLALSAVVLAVGTLGSRFADRESRPKG